jgi:hypothetical protein
MKLKIDLSKFKHDKEKSVYNKNYYTSENGEQLLQICHEDYQFMEYKLVDGDKEVFLGCSEEMFKDEFEIDFLEYYT